MEEFNKESLHELIRYFRSLIAKHGAEGWKDSSSAIQAIVYGDSEQCRAAASQLQQNGYQVNPILYPTVPKGSERLRICLHTFNTKEQADGLFEVITATKGA